LKLAQDSATKSLRTTACNLPCNLLLAFAFLVAAFLAAVFLVDAFLVAVYLVDAFLVSAFLVDAFANLLGCLFKLSGQ